MGEYALVEEKCFFCNSEETLAFSEHYTFCPECTSIYTIMIPIQKCECLLDTSPTVTREPWYKEIRDNAKPHIIEDVHRQKCSVCDSTVIYDGW